MNQKLQLPVKLASFLILIALLAAPGVGWGQTTINFDDAAKWTAGSVALTSYASDHTYVDGVFSATGGPALRNTTAAQDGFAGAFGTYSWRLTNAACNWVTTIASGGVSTFSVAIRRWDASPSPAYTLDYSVNGGANWVNVALVNNTTLNNSSDWTTFNGTINSSNPNILIRLNSTGSTERIMVDNFVWTGYSGGNPTAATPTFSPVAGTFYSAQNVTLSCETENSTIYYTTDGSDPDDTDTEYTAAIPVNSTTTIKAIAYADGYDPSEIATATYTIVTQFAVTFYVDMSNQTGFTTVDVAGGFNNWGNPGDVLTSAGNGIYTFTTGAIFSAGQTIEFKFRKDGDWATSEPNPNRSYTVVAGPANDYHAVYGVMSPASIGWANLQWPDAGTIVAGGTYDVYSRVYMAGVTEPAGQGANISAWIGYSTSNTNPNTWTNWVAADYNVDDFNNDEYKGTLTGLTPGTYYYASRFQYKNLEYVYGGFNGGFWDGTNNVSGVLTVETAPIAVPDIIITEVYGGGGNSGATLINDFIELFNTTTMPVDISGWSIQYYSATGTGTPSAANLFVLPSGSIVKPKAHFLIQAAAGSGGSVSLPAPDAVSTIALGGSSGKVILYTADAAQSITNDIASITGNVNFKDYLPYGTAAVPVWGSATANASNTTSASRIVNSGTYVYTHNIGNDFEIVTPNPQNSQLNYRTVADGTWSATGSWETYFRGSDWFASVALPSGSDDVLVNHDINISSTADCNNLTIGTGSLTIANGGSFIPTGTVTGNVTAIRNISGLNQYHFLSSPISNAALGDVFPAGDVFNIYMRSYNETTGNWVNMEIPANMTSGAGYSFFMDIASTTATFTGTLNNSNISPVVSNSGNSGNLNYDGWNLLGNPFASAIQWGLGNWALTNINNEVHVWSNGVYLSYAGGAGSLTDGIIPAQQGFFVKANASGPSITIPTAARLHSSQGFYKNNIADLLRLDVSGSTNYSDATFVRFSEDATEGFDAAFDAHKLDNDADAPMLYTMNAEKRFSINTLRSASETPEIPVYFKAGTNGDYTITASGIESFSNRIIYLTDNLTGLRHDLRQNPVYAFSAAAGDDANRFKLSFATVGIEEPSGLNIGVYAAGNQIRLVLPELMKGRVNISNLSGQLLYSQNFNGSGELGIGASYPAGVYLVTVISANGSTTRKVFVN